MRLEEQINYELSKTGRNTVNLHPGVLIRRLPLTGEVGGGGFRLRVARLMNVEAGAGRFERQGG